MNSKRKTLFDDKYNFQTPMMQQYMEFKKQYNDCILFFRLGDFYETFLEDAIITSKELGITLTRRTRGKDGDIPMAGVPYHSVNNYIKRLVNAGYKIAICDQSEETTENKIVKRKITKIITPGTIIDDELLENKNNYLAYIEIFDNHSIFILSDISTGEILIKINKTKNINSIIDLILKYSPKELLITQFSNINKKDLKKIQVITNLFLSSYNIKNKYIQNKNIENLKIEQIYKKALYHLIEYLQYIKKQDINNLQDIKLLENKDTISLDPKTISSLDLINNKKNKSLLSILDKTCTPMGHRFLKTQILNPLKNKKIIQQRHEFIEFFIKQQALLEEVRYFLTQISDIQRIISKLLLNSQKPKNIIDLSTSLKNFIKVKKILKKYTLNKNIFDLDIDLKYVQDIINFINENIELWENKIIIGKNNKQIAKLNEKLNLLTSNLVNYEKQEQIKTNIPTLKIKFNKIFGFFIEVSKSYTNKIPNYYIRQQTLVNAERYITEKLKNIEYEIKTLEQKKQELENKLYEQIIAFLNKNIDIFYKINKYITFLDFITNLAYVALKNNYTRPKLTNDQTIFIKQGRHPILEKNLDESNFIPNDTTMNKQDFQIMLLTGPNMAGKSVYIRQVALICIMNQIGSFVSANKSKLFVFDNIFARSGSGDNILQNQSTFMVEMDETAFILKNITNNSLIIMDEIGRGTSTFDGISLAWAIIEYLTNQENKKALSLFATHYHELQYLEDIYPTVKNYHLKVEQQENNLIFLHKIQKGVSSNSFGIEVGKLAGLPEEIIEKAYQILNKLSNKNNDIKNQINKLKQNNSKLEKTLTNQKNLSLIEYEKLTKLKNDIQNLELENITPIQALNILFDLKQKYK